MKCRDEQTDRQITITNQLIIKMHMLRHIRFYTIVQLPLRKYTIIINGSISARQ